METKIDFWLQFRPEFEGFYLIQDNSGAYKLPLEQGNAIVARGLLTLEEHQEDLNHYHHHKNRKTKTAEIAA